MMRIAIALCVLVASAAAQPEAPRAEPRPWAEGVTPERQTRALELFRQGNDAFAQASYMAAVRLYRDALADWDHPAIRGNLATALVHLDQPVEAFLEIERAFRYGPTPFEPTVYAQLQTNHKLLAGQIGRIEIVGDVAGATVLLDGIEVPPRVRHVIRAGAHELVARRPGYLTFTSRVVAIADNDVVIRVVLVPLTEAGRLVRKWDPWKPWVVAGAGAAVTLAGVGFQLAASNNVEDYELEISRACPQGCDPADLPRAVRDLESRARWQNRVGIAALGVGGAALATGVVLLWLNQPYRERVDESGHTIGLAPVIAPGLGGIAGSLSF